MRNIWTIASREFNLYFATPVAYVISFVILVILGVWFYLNVLDGMVQGYAPGVNITINLLIDLLLFGIPAITMRLLAEEQRAGTIELLLTAPVRDYELVVGKWLGGFLFMLTLLAVTLVFPFALNYMVSPGVDQGLLVTGYLGLILLAAAFSASCLSTSAGISSSRT